MNGNGGVFEMYLLRFDYTIKIIVQSFISIQIYRSTVGTKVLLSESLLMTFTRNELQIMPETHAGENI